MFSLLGIVFSLLGIVFSRGFKIWILHTQHSCNFSPCSDDLFTYLINLDIIHVIDYEQRRRYRQNLAFVWLPCGCYETMDFHGCSWPYLLGFVCLAKSSLEVAIFPSTAYRCYILNHCLMPSCMAHGIHGGGG